MSENSTELYTHWEDLESNTIAQLHRMLKDLEIPYRLTASKSELIEVINCVINKDKNGLKETYLIDKKQRKYEKYAGPIKFFIAMVLIGVFLEYIRIVFRKGQYCGENNTSITCKQCPDGAKCKKGKAYCLPGSALTPIGCKPVQYRRIYKAAARASKYLAYRAGDCIEKQQALSIQRFIYLFPSVPLSLFEHETDFSVALANDSIISTNPQQTIFCKTMIYFEDHETITGSLILFAFIYIGVLIFRFKMKQKEEIARDLAQQAHKILLASDKQIYIYDMKVQLRDKYPKIDSIWNSVIKAVEEDSHVVVGNKGARYEIYWKWIHNQG